MAYPFLIRGVLDGLGDSFVVTDTVPTTEVRLGDDVFTPLTPATFTLTLSNTGAGIVAAGKATATFSTTCVRCLCDFDLEVSADVDGFYVKEGDDADLPEEQEREYIHEERIDLGPASPEPAARSGTRFGRYEVGELLGSGGMGAVYSAHDPELGRAHAGRRVHGWPVGLPPFDPQKWPWNHRASGQ